MKYLLLFLFCNAITIEASQVAASNLAGTQADKKGQSEFLDVSKWPGTLSALMKTIPPINDTGEIEVNVPSEETIKIFFLNKDQQKVTYYDKHEHFPDHGIVRMSYCNDEQPVDLYYEKLQIALVTWAVRNHFVEVPLKSKQIRRYKMLFDPTKDICKIKSFEDYLE